MRSQAHWVSSRTCDCSMEGLATTPLPAIVERIDGRYVVLAKVQDDKVLIHDPLEARSLVQSRETFVTTWSGRLLLCAKRAGLRAQDLAFDITWFIPAVLKYRRLLGEVFLASFFLQLFALLTPLFTQVVIDKVLVHKGFTTLHVVAIGMLALALFDGFLGGLRTYLFAHTTNRIDVSLGRNCSGIFWPSLSSTLNHAGSAIRSHACANSNISVNFSPVIR
jgi:subfamily B ATP-binding cassette protein HlyB/CyaB